MASRYSAGCQRSTPPRAEGGDLARVRRGGHPPCAAVRVPPDQPLRRPEQGPAATGPHRLGPLGKGPAGGRAGDPRPGRGAAPDPGQAARPSPAAPARRTHAWQQEFEASFPFTETPDQLKAIDETKADMERTRPMDRLICGDVGFRQDRGGDPGRLQGGPGRPPGGGARPDDDPRPAAPQHLPRAHGRLPGRHRDAQPLPHRRREQKQILAAPAHGPGGHPDRHPPAAPGRRAFQGARAGRDRRGAALRREAQGGVQAHARDGRRPVDERDADPAHALSRPHRGPGPERDRDAARPTAIPSRPSSRPTRRRSSSTRSATRSAAAARSSTCTTGSRRSTWWPPACAAAARTWRSASATDRWRPPNSSG